MTADELRALVAQGPAVVMASREDMLALLDENARLREVLGDADTMLRFAAGKARGAAQAALIEQGRVQLLARAALAPDA